MRRRWAEALGTAHGTRWEALGRAQEFLWRQWHSWSPERKPDTPPDYPALLAELGQLRTALQASPRDKLTERTLNNSTAWSTIGPRPTSNWRSHSPSGPARPCASATVRAD